MIIQFLIVLSFITPLLNSCIDNPHSKSSSQTTLAKISPFIGVCTSHVTLAGFYYGTYTQLLEVSQKLLKTYLSAPSVPGKVARYTSHALALTTLTPLAIIIHYYCKRPLEQTITMLISGKKLSGAQSECCIDQAIEYAHHLQILNTLRLEINDVINNINVTHYQTFNNRPDILDTIFTQITKDALISDLDKLFDIHNALLIEMSREIYVIIDNNKIASQHLSHLQEIISRIKQHEKESYEIMISYARTSNQLGMYHLLHDIYAQLKIVKAGLHQGIDVHHAASLLHQALMDFLKHWSEIAYPLYHKVEVELVRYYHLQTLERIIGAFRSISY
jgi:hypothetical protein